MAQAAIEKNYAGLKIILHRITNWHVHEHTDLTRLMGSRIRAYRIALGIDRKAVSMNLNIDSQYLSCIETGDQYRGYLNLGIYLRYLNLLDLNIYDILTQPVPVHEKQLHTKKMCDPEIPDREEYYTQKVRKAIHDLSSTRQRISANAIARMIHVSACTLYRYKKVKELLPAWKLNKTDHERQLTAELAQVKIIYEDLCKKGQRPLMKDIAKIMGVTFDRSPEIKAWFQCKRIESRMKLDEAILEQLDMVVDKLISRGQFPTNEILSKELRVSHHVFVKRSRVRQKLNEIRRRLRAPVSFAREADLLAQIHKVRHEMQLRGVRETQTEIARRTYMSVAGLMKYPKIKVIMKDVAKASKKKKTTGY